MASSERFIANARRIGGTCPAARNPRLRRVRTSGLRAVAARGEPVCRGDHALGDRPAGGFVGVQLCGVGGTGEHVGEDRGERRRVLDAGVHALAARGAVDVGGVTRQEHPAVPVGVGQAVVDLEPGAPHDVPDAAIPAAPSPNTTTISAVKPTCLRCFASRFAKAVE